MSESDLFRILKLDINIYARRTHRLRGCVSTSHNVGGDLAAPKRRKEGTDPFREEGAGLIGGKGGHLSRSGGRMMFSREGRVNRNRSGSQVWLARRGRA